MTTTAYDQLRQVATNLPRHVAIIMDGNGRWAEERGLPRIEGHREGAQSVRDIVRACRQLDLDAITLYAFSAQNWGRPSEEVRGLMELLRDYIVEERTEIMDNRIRLCTIGETERLPDFVKNPLYSLMADSAGNQGMFLTLALSYGSRESMVTAAKAAALAISQGQIAASSLNEETFGQLLPTRFLPSLDLMIRTSGEQRISNFLLWEAAYAELYFTETMWPDFRREQLYEALLTYSARERRFGLTSKQVNT